MPVVAAAWLLAASFVGAEWHAGTMGTLLTWEPRRLYVLGAKVAALTEGVLKAMLMTKLQTAGAVLLLAALVRLGGSALAQRDGDRKATEAAPAAAAEDAVGGRLKIRFTGFVNVRDEFLRVAVDDRKPGALNLHHDFVAFEEAMV